MNEIEVELKSSAVGFSGEILSPGDPEYDRTRTVWNAMIDRRPAAIARCQNIDDVIAAVRLANARNLPMSIRGGGHNVAGHAVGNDSVMIDLSQLRAVDVDANRRIAIVEGGALWRDVDSATQKHGLATPGGLISDTGVAGLTLSGGVGWLRARHGLSVDNLLAADVVTADGALIRASVDENPDLLWALQGGGGNFGIVVRFEFALHPIGPEVMFAAPIYALKNDTSPIRAWRDFMVQHGESVGSLCEFSTIPDSEDFPKKHWGENVYMLGCVFNGDAEEGEKVLQPLREYGDLVADFSAHMNYCDIQQLFDTLMPAGEFRCYWKARFLRDLPDQMINLAIQNAISAPSKNSISSLWHIGGAISEVASDATAFGDRSMGWMYSLDSVWSDSHDDAINIDWSREAWSSAEHFGHQGRAYLNFAGHGEDGAILTRKSFGPNYDRLVEIKTKYDPQNKFRFNQNIVPIVD